MKKISKIIIFLFLLCLFIFTAPAIDKLYKKSASDPGNNKGPGDSLSVASDPVSEKNNATVHTSDNNHFSGSKDWAMKLTDKNTQSHTGNADKLKSDTEAMNNNAYNDSEPLNQESLRKLNAGTVINPELLESADNIIDLCFYYEEIKDDIKARIQGKSYKDDCTVPYEDLRYVRVLYYGFDEKTHIGELIVNKTIASDIVDIFAELYENQYPIERMVLVDEYDANDNASMADNNTSSFNYRAVPGSTHLSKHALGLAIDINPLYNPYIRYDSNETTVLPVEGSKYADRSLDCPYYINEEDLCYKAFTKRGFTWGGIWKNSPDYQHFQKTVD